MNEAESTLLEICQSQQVSWLQILFNMISTIDSTHSSVLNTFESATYIILYSSIAIMNEYITIHHHPFMNHSSMIKLKCIYYCSDLDRCTYSILTMHMYINLIFLIFPSPVHVTDIYMHHYIDTLYMYCSSYT